MAKLMSRASTVAVETGLASGDSARRRSHCLQTKNPPTLIPATTSNVRNNLINEFPSGRNWPLEWTGPQHFAIQSLWLTLRRLNAPHSRVPIHGRGFGLVRTIRGI